MPCSLTLSATPTFDCSSMHALPPPPASSDPVAAHLLWAIGPPTHAKRAAVPEHVVHAAVLLAFVLLLPPLWSCAFPPALPGVLEHIHATAAHLRAVSRRALETFGHRPLWAPAVALPGVRPAPRSGRWQLQPSTESSVC